jgi:hypothetical protein
MEETGEKRVNFKREFPCPHCGFLISLESGKLVVRPGTKAETKEYIEIRKSEQTRLESEAEQ